jgi:hypothetical protein
LKRPKKLRLHKQKPKTLAKGYSKAVLEEVAAKATYEHSDYHCPRPKGQGPARRLKPSTHCPRDWTPRQGLNAVREAIRTGRVSTKWVGGFPRYIWHKEGDVWYEGQTKDSSPGKYHGYPQEVLPVGLRE